MGLRQQLVCQEIVDKNLHTNHLGICLLYVSNFTLGCDQSYMHANKTLKNGINVLLYSCTN